MFWDIEKTRLPDKECPTVPFRRNKIIEKCMFVLFCYGKFER